MGAQIVAVPAYVFVEWFQWLLPIGLGSAAGFLLEQGARAGAQLQGAARTLPPASS